MIILLETKTNINGHKTQILFNTDKKIYYRDYDMWAPKSDLSLTVTKQKLNNANFELDGLGFNRTYERADIYE